MDYERLFGIADSARAGKRLSPPDIAFMAEAVPTDLASFPHVELPKTVRHPAGFSITGAPVGTFLRSALLLAGRKAFGSRYKGEPFFERVERDVAFGIMRSHFHNGYPKGAFCCAQCTLAIYPVLEAGAIRYFDSRALAAETKKLIRGRRWRFASPANPKMLQWSLAD